MDSFIPFSDKTIVEVFQSQLDRFSSFSKLFDKAEIMQRLSLNHKSLTLLAPTNAALEKLPQGALDCLLQERNRRQLRLFVLVHVSHPAEYSSTLSQRQVIRTLTHYSILVTAEDDTVSLTRGMIAIEESDIPARDGVIHALPDPIVPPAINFTTLCSI